MGKWEQLENRLAELTQIVDFLADGSDRIEIDNGFDPFVENFCYRVKFINNKKLCEVNFPFNDYDKKEIVILQNNKEKAVFKCTDSKTCVYCVLDKANEEIIKYNFEEMEEVKKLINS